MTNNYDDEILSLVWDNTSVLDERQWNCDGPAREVARGNLTSSWHYFLTPYWRFNTFMQRSTQNIKLTVYRSSRIFLCWGHNGKQNNNNIPNRDFVQKFTVAIGAFSLWTCILLCASKSHCLFLLLLIRFITDTFSLTLTLPYTVMIVYVLHI